MIAALLAVVLLAPAAKAGVSGPPELSAACAILVDGESGRVLFEHNARQERDIASITKLMTALVVVERISALDEEVVIRPEWTGAEGSSLYLKAGESITVEALLYGLLLNSGNDAAVTLAAYCAGSVDTFVAWMNERAESLGMNQTHFCNPNGLSEEGHFSTAYDMALLAMECKKNEYISEITATKSITFGTRTFTNHNKLLWRYEGCTGMKTGYTQRAGRTLVSCAERDGRILIAVTLHAPNDWSDHTVMFDYGFQTYRRQLLCRAGKQIGHIPVYGSLVQLIPVVTEGDVYYPLRESEKLRASVKVFDFLDAPIEEGAPVGSLSFYLEDELIGETNLVAGDTVFLDKVKSFSLMERIENMLQRN